MEARQAFDIATGAAELDSRTIHVRVGGTSHELNLYRLGITASSSDSEIRESVSRHLDIELAKFNNTVVERHSTGNLTIRPEAIFG